MFLPREDDTRTLTSSIFNYRWENGRRYHAFRDGEYWYVLNLSTSHHPCPSRTSTPTTRPKQIPSYSLYTAESNPNHTHRCPNDAEALTQLNLGHHIYLLLLQNRLFLAPITPHPSLVLDIGTGTGIWAIDFADQYPSATVIGTDLSPTQPSYVPPNLQFEIDDAASPWTFPKDSFDFIHVRGLFGSLRDWPEFYAQVLAHLKPGGWYEQLECSCYCHADDDTTPPGSPLHRWGGLFTEAGRLTGKTVDVIDHQYAWLQEAGFEEVTEHRFKMPDNPWPSAKTPEGRRLKEIGKWRRLEIEMGMEGWSLAMFTRVLGMTFEEVQVYLAEVRRDWRDRRVHAYTRVGVVYGRKPGG